MIGEIRSSRVDLAMCVLKEMRRPAGEASIVSRRGFRLARVRRKAHFVDSQLSASEAASKISAS